MANTTDFNQISENLKKISESNSNDLIKPSSDRLLKIKVYLDENTGNVIQEGPDGQKVVIRKRK